MVEQTVRGLGLVLLVGVVVMPGCNGGSEVPEISARAIEIESDTRVPSSPLLIDKLSAGSLDERLRAARAIGRIQSPAYLDALERALTDESVQVRVATVFAIGQLGLVPDQAVDPRASEIVTPILAEEDPKLIVAALEALGKLAAPDAAAAITPLLSHGDPAVRAEAAYALFRCRFAPLWRREVDEPPALPNQAAETLVSAMQDPDANVRFAATYAFSRYGDARARQALIDALTDRDARVRLFAVRGLGHVADEAAIPHLIERLSDEHAGVRVEAVGALRRAARYDVLDGMASDRSFHVRSTLAQALGNASTPGSLETLQGLTEDDSATVRAAAVSALALRLGPEALERLSGWIESDDWRIRVAAARSLGGVGPTVADLAARAFEDPDNRVRAAVVAGMAETSFGDALVVEAVKSDDLAIRGEAVARVAERASLDRLALFDAALADSPGEIWVEVRESIVDALAGIDGSEALLRRTLADDPAPSVRGKAAAALGESPPVPALEAPFSPSPWIEAETPAGTTVDLETVHGTMRIEMLPDEAPIHVASFLERVDAGFYDGLIWHRVVSNFVIQGGDPRGDGWGSDGASIRDEINGVRYDRGMLGMPKAGKDTGGCQLFVTHVPTPHLDGNYTVFGRVVAGGDVIDAIQVGDAILRIQRTK